MPSKKHIRTLASRQVLRLIFCILIMPGLVGCGSLNSLAGPTATQTASPNVTATLTPSATLTPTNTPTPTEIPPLCGGPATMYILLVGSDARSDSYKVGLSDSMRLVRIDFTRPRLQVITFPRDLYVEIPEIQSHHGITHGKLNQAYLYGNPGYNYYDGPGQGPGLLALTLEHNFDVHVDHYVAVNIQTFVSIIDNLGGIDIDLPYTVDGRVKHSTDPNRYFPAGNQHLNGYRTMLLARMRPVGDFRRIEIQNMILQAVAEKLLNPPGIKMLPALLWSFHDSIQTDLGPTEISQLLCMRRKLNTQDIVYGNFPAHLFKNGRVHDPVLGNTSILEVDFNVLRGYVDSFNQGDWPPIPEDHQRPPDP